MKKTMRACAAVAPGKLELVEVPIPEPDDYEVLVKNEGCVFCNTTDRMITDALFATPAYPTLLGHEDFGIVVKVGSKVKKFRLGDRVICASATKGFNGTYHSTWGGFAEYGIAGDWEAYCQDHGAPPPEELYRRRYRHNHILPADLLREQAALAFSLAETASALAQVGSLEGKTVVVIGTGFVGYSFVYFAKKLGAGQVICLGRRESRLAVAEQLGADRVYVDTERACEEILALGGADVVLEASGNYRALEGGLPYLKEGGIFAVYAVPRQPYAMDLQRCPRDFRFLRIEPKVAEKLAWVCTILGADFPTGLFLTHQWPFDEMVEAFEEVRSGQVIKGLVCMPEETLK
jgi:L-iditol 2-dehydrogenase